MSLRRRQLSQGLDEDARDEIRVVDDLDDEGVAPAAGRRLRSRAGGAASRQASAGATDEAADADEPTGADARGSGTAARRRTGSGSGTGGGPGDRASSGRTARARDVSGAEAAEVGEGQDAPAADKPRDKKPLYPRLLRLRHIQPNAWQRAALGEGAIGLGVLLAMADLATAWGIVVLPVAVAGIVKAHDALQGLLDPRDDRPQAGSGDSADDAQAPTAT